MVSTVIIIRKGVPRPDLQLEKRGAPPFALLNYSKTTSVPLNLIGSLFTPLSQ